MSRSLACGFLWEVRNPVAVEGQHGMKLFTEPCSQLHSWGWQGELLNCRGHRSNWGPEKACQEPWDIGCSVLWSVFPNKKLLRVKEMGKWCAKIILSSQRTYMILDWQSWKGNCCNAKCHTYQVLFWCFACKQTRLVAWGWTHEQLHCPSTPLHPTWGCQVMRATINIWDFW